MSNRVNVVIDVSVAMTHALFLKLNSFIQEK